MSEVQDNEGKQHNHRGTPDSHSYSLQSINSIEEQMRDQLK